MVYSLHFLSAALERSEHIAEWVRLTADKPAQVAPVSAKGGRGIEGGLSAASTLPSENSVLTAPKRSARSKSLSNQWLGSPHLLKHLFAEQAHIERKQLRALIVPLHD
jgi:hypothetical protein